MPEAYCLKCRAQREIVGAEEVMSKNGRAMLKGKCETCNSTLTRMIKSDKPKVVKPKVVKFEVTDENNEAVDSFEAVEPVKEKKPRKTKQTGGLAPVAVLSGVAGVASVMNSLGLLTPLKSLISSLGKELEYVLLNPNASRWKSIYTERLPNLALKYDLIGNDIEFLQRKKESKIRDNKINRFERKRADILALANMLLTQLPRYKQLAESKDEQLQEREQAKVNAKINDLEAQLDTLKGSGIEKKKVVSMEDN